MAAPRLGGANGAGYAAGLVHKQVEKQRITDEVVDQLRSLILAGHYPPGSRLPAERDLARSLGVNRSSLREALKKLENMGLLTIRQGDGTRITNFMEHAGLELVQHLIPLADSGYPRIIRDAMEFRLFYCREVARLAAVRRTDDDLERLRQLAARCEAAGDTLAELLEPAFEFFAVLTSAAKNSLMGLLINSARNALRSHGPLLANFLISREVVCGHQRDVIAALEASDPERAVVAVSAHIEQSNRYLMELLESHQVELPSR